jgi:hypothetical protein
MRSHLEFRILQGCLSGERWGVQNLGWVNALLSSTTNSYYHDTPTNLTNVDQNTPSFSGIYP